MKEKQQNGRDKSYLSQHAKSPCHSDWFSDGYKTRVEQIWKVTYSVIEEFTLPLAKAKDDLAGADFPLVSTSRANLGMWLADMRKWITGANKLILG